MTSISAASLTLWTTLIAVPMAYVIWIIVSRVRWMRRFFEYFRQLPGGQPHWLFGDLYYVPGPGEAGLKWICDVVNKCEGGVRQFWFSPLHPSAFVYHPESVKTILKTSEPKPLRFGVYHHLLPWLGEGLLTSRGQKWARNRRLLTPAFHFDILRPYMAVNNRCTDLFLAKLDQFAERNEYFEVFQHISLLTLDIILRCAFSYDNDCQRKAHNDPYVVAVNTVQEAVVYRAFRPWLYPQFVFNRTEHGRQFNKNCKYVHDVSDNIIQKRKLALKTEIEGQQRKTQRYLDFLDILLTARDDQGQGLSDQEIRDEVDTFLFEGHDTTSSGISWTLYSLAEHPHHQQRCQQEIDDVIAQHPNHQDIDWDDLPKLKYLTMCLKESLRLHTPVPYIERRTTKDMTFQGRLLPAYSHIAIVLYALHHNKEVWTDPEEYKPERFSDENAKQHDNFALLAFSAGPRNCIGQHFAMHEMKTAIARILHRFTLSVDAKRPARHKVVVVMKTEDGMYIKATPRQNTELI